MPFLGIHKWDFRCAFYLLKRCKHEGLQHIWAFYAESIFLLFSVHRKIFLFERRVHILSINTGSLVHAAKCKMRLPLAQVETPTPVPSLNSWSSDSWRQTETRPRSSGGIRFLYTARKATPLERNPPHYWQKWGVRVEHWIRNKREPCSHGSFIGNGSQPPLPFQLTQYQQFQFVYQTCPALPLSSSV